LQTDHESFDDAQDEVRLCAASTIERCHAQILLTLAFAPLHRRVGDRAAWTAG